MMAVVESLGFLTANGAGFERIRSSGVRRCSRRRFKSCMNAEEGEVDLGPNVKRRRYRLRMPESSSKSLQSVDIVVPWDGVVLEKMFRLDEDVWKQVVFLINRPLVKDMANVFALVGAWILHSARSVLKPLLSKIIEDAEIQQVSSPAVFEFEFGIVTPNECDRFYVDPLTDWQLTNKTYYKDSFGNKIYCNTYSVVSPDEFREFERYHPGENGFDDSATGSLSTEN